MVFYFCFHIFIFKFFHDQSIKVPYLNLLIMFSAFGTAAANGGGIDEKTARKLLEEEVSIPPF
jgi:hypothetical protein